MTTKSDTSSDAITTRRHIWELVYHDLTARQLTADQVLEESRRYSDFVLGTEPAPNGKKQA